MKKLISKLFSVHDTNVYGVIDGASCPGLLDLFEEHDVEFKCLYSGELNEELAMTAPYMVRLSRSSSFLKLWLEEGWDQHWGFFAVSYADFRVMRRHFRKFIRVRNPESKIIYFRYYDPRVMNAFLPVCSTSEFKSLLGPSLFYLSEAEVEGKAHVYSLYREAFHEQFLDFAEPVEA